MENNHLKNKLLAATMLRNICVVMVILASTLCYASVAFMERIVGGQVVDIANYPYQLALFCDAVYICGASIVSPRYALTAAHCTLNVNATDLVLRAGSSRAHSGGRLHQVAEYVVHPMYDDYNLDCDVSVLIVKNKFDVGTPGILNIQLPQDNRTLDVGFKVIASGYGYTNAQATNISEELRVVELEILDWTICKTEYSFYEELTKRMLCAGDSNGVKDACLGDSGGPLVADNTLYGIISKGIGCAEKDKPGVYTSVVHPAVRGFIFSVTEM